MYCLQTAFTGSHLFFVIQRANIIFDFVECYVSVLLRIGIVGGR